MDKVEKIKEKPKFKVGDTICNKIWPTACHTIESIDSESYYLDNGGKVEIAHQDLWELVQPVSNDLEEAAHFYVDTTIEWFDSEGNPCCYPAFIAGAQWQKDHTCFAGRTKTIEEIKEALLSEVLPCFMHGGEADEVVAKLDEVLNQK